MTKRYVYLLGALLLLLSAPVSLDHTARTDVLSATMGMCPDVTNSLYFTIVYGSVTVDGSAAPVGAVVEARNPRGDVVGCAIVIEAGSYGTLYVYGEDTSVTPSVPGMREGEMIAFYVDGQLAATTPTLVWNNDHQIHVVNLVVGETPVTPTATPTVAPPGTCPTVPNTLYFTLVYGTVNIDGNPAPAGTVVAARNPRGDIVGCFVLTEAGNYGTLYVYGEDTSVTPAVPGMREGETVAFYVNGHLASASPDLVWMADQTIHQINLNATSDTPTPTPGLPPQPPYTCPNVENTLRMTIVYGAVTLNGIPAPANTVIEARNSKGATTGCFEVTQAGNYGTLYVYGEDATVTPPLPGMQPGEAIAFYVNGHPATAIPDLTWENDRAYHQVDLSARIATETRIFLPLVLRGFPSTHPDFSLSINPETLTLAQDDSGMFTIDIVKENGFSDLITLTVAGIPTNTDVVWIESPLIADSHDLRITTTLDTPVGTYALQITGTSDAVAHSTDATLIIEEGQPAVNGVMLYESPNYEGNTIVLTESDPNLVDNDFNDKVSSLQIFGAYTVTLYGDVHYEGQASIFTTSDPDLSNDPIGNARASSIQIESHSP